MNKLTLMILTTCLFAGCTLIPKAIQDREAWDGYTLEQKREMWEGYQADIQAEGMPIGLSPVLWEQIQAELIAEGDKEIARIDRQIELRDNPPPEPVPPVVITKPPSAGVAPGGGSGGFLWKPDSESTGNLVVLLPGKLHKRTLGKATLSGSFGSETVNMRHEHHNGNRPHFYFSRPGSAYGTNIKVTAPLIDGSTYTTTVPNGAQRME